MSSGFCNCRGCRAQRRKGNILGSRMMGYFSQGIFGFGNVSDYVTFRKFAKGRSRKEKWPRNFW